MSTCEFSIEVRGYTVRSAFDCAVRQSQQANGDSGYSGTIAEKEGFIIIELPAGEDALEFAQRLMNEQDDRICNSDSPAGCIVKTEGHVNTAFPVRTTVEQSIYKGTRTWESFYVGYTSIYNEASGHKEKRQKFSLKFKDEAVEEARRISIRDNAKVEIVMEKKVTNSSPVVTTITPVPVADNSVVGTYLFFGLASD